MTLLLCRDEGVRPTQRDEAEPYAALLEKAHIHVKRPATPQDVY